MVTIKDIAKTAGVSHTTVSRALNNSPLIKEATRKKIHELAAEMNYVPNFNAKSLVNQKNYMIGLFFSSIEEGTSSSFLVDVIKGIHSRLDESYGLSVQGIDEIQNLEQINFQRYDGIIIMSQSDSDQGFIDFLKQQQIPFVVLNRQLEDKHIINISADDAAGVETAIDYAISQGHRKIACIGGIEGFRSARERKAGLINSLTKHHLPINVTYFFEGDYSIEGGFQEMKKILLLKDLPTLVFCANDDMAIGAIRAAEESGLHIPQDISFIGFDDIPFVAYLNPPLTTVHKPINEISRQGTELLLNLIAGNQTTSSQVKIPTRLEIRKSVAKLETEKNL
ncbi:LacI family DNA-binding transcriptional regulator [Enterococcus sp. BWB1-3]|uniref:LacI family DNA-binding transcriptional regulator n=1 Tax=unclassified Enterococcus TaxID=2608891 RepID=UPI0019208678|nr:MULTISPECIES: LacI family DNA-binding transcriptional regulator [unclassified Enterococcus]MBL1230206.1 LacI family DNA-binding transcriptional regulator [Enterococcus sp. BWB1-3]MCB5953206.1 LacI family transcriptional regulator [Enterococcus sp. BWT-B8]MCB5953751.1 LacI family transcriptional regulator [Enterococcus sp. CWB-B31]